PADDLRLPDLYLALYDRALCWDGLSWSLEHTAAWREEDAVAEAEKTLRAAGRKALPPSVETAEIADGPVSSLPDAAGFQAAVRRSVERVHRGEICQVNLCRRLEAELPAASLWPFYARLRAASPAGHGAWIDLGRGRAVMSVSPELFLSARGGLVESRPIKGTRPRGEDPKTDRALGRELVESAKDRAELAMIVDVVRNDLGRVAVTGSVEVVRHADLVSLPTVHHTVSTVRARLKPGCGAPELLRAAFPAASITGAPKIQAMAIAAAEEPRRRGPAMGAFGWISLSGDLDLAVAIRTAAAAGGRIAYHAGCGIVADSTPESELEESRVKARAFLTALGAREE
ncbi:MAG TPA: anthranilate synthase component I family protein, partial [Thermoanaerobaculia bacterium]|nr:anthranilate synthase component I family protein [Thermoanaerobaculia bacterium]